MNRRDFDYIEKRLLAPDVAVGEAIGRLRQEIQVGNSSFMEKEELENIQKSLMRASQDYHDKVREIRKMLVVVGRRYA